MSSSDPSLKVSDLLKGLGITMPTPTQPQQGIGQGGGALPTLSPAQPVGDVQNYVKQLSDQTFGPGEWGSLSNLIQHESGWNPTAKNPTSTASGLFQFLDHTAASHGLQGSAADNPLPAQVQAGFNYIKQRYGTPSNAWNFWQNVAPTKSAGNGSHWY